jgi:hypothetical protein
MVAGCDTLPTDLTNVLQVLLAAASPSPTDESVGPRLLWAEEGMHRAYCMLKLVMALRDSGRWTRCGASRRTALDRARDIAMTYRSLAEAEEGRVVPCAPLLETLVVDLLELFGPTVGDVSVELVIDRVALPGRQRRALILIASELVVNTLLYEFRGRRHGSIHVALERLDHAQVRLRVCNNGKRASSLLANVTPGAAENLASFLGAPMRYYQTDRWAAVAEIAVTAPGAVLKHRYDQRRLSVEPITITSEIGHSSRRILRERRAGRIQAS